MSRISDGPPARARQPGQARFTVVIACLVLMASTRSALADGWKVQLQGVKALGLSYAGRSIVDDGSVVWFNPAGMTRLKQRWTVTFGGPAINYRLDYRDRGSTSLLGQPLNGPSTGDGGRTSGVPHIYVVRNFGNKLWFGTGVNVPYGLGSDYGERWVGRYQATKTELTVVNVNPAIAFKATERLSLGFGLDVQRSTARLANMIDFGSIGAAVGLPLRPLDNDGAIEVDGSAVGVGADLSLAWSIDSRARLALTYRSQITHRLEGTARFTVPAAATLLTAGGTIFKDTGARFTLPMPHELSTSGSYELRPGVVLVGDVTWTDWSRFERLTIAFDNVNQPPVSQEADFRDSIRSAAGVVFSVAPRVELRAGGLYETTPVPDATRTPRLPEANNAGFSGGLSYRLGPRADVDFSFSHLIPHKAPIVLESPAAGTLVGDVRWRLDIVGVALNLRL